MVFPTQAELTFLYQEMPLKPDLASLAKICTKGFRLPVSKRLHKNSSKRHCNKN